MPAISVKVGTKQACSNNFVGDQICLQSQLGWGPYINEEDLLNSKTICTKIGSPWHRDTGTIKRPCYQWRGQCTTCKSLVMAVLDDRCVKQ